MTRYHALTGKAILPFLGAPARRVRAFQRARVSARPAAILWQLQPPRACRTTRRAKQARAAADTPALGLERAERDGGAVVRQALDAITDTDWLQLRGGADQEQVTAFRSRLLENAEYEIRALEV
jgi:hypothetical protein